MNTNADAGWRCVKTDPPPKDGTPLLLSGPRPWLPDLVQWMPERKKRDMEWGRPYSVPRGWFCCSGGRSRYDDGTGELRHAQFWMFVPTPPPKDSTHG